MKKALQKPVVVFVFSRNHGPTSTRFGGFVTRLQKQGQLQGIESRVVALEELIISIDAEQTARVVNLDGTDPFLDASLVYFKSWESMPELASAVSCYLESMGIPVLDELIHGQGFSKLSQLMRMWAGGVRITPFVFSYAALTDEHIKSHIGEGPYIVKDAFGEKGKKNFYAKTATEAAKLAATYPMMLLQPFIPNNGDWRVLTYGHKVRGGIFRQGVAGSHLNNTSAGASSEYSSAEDMPEDVKKEAVKAARLCMLSVAGVDVMTHRDTGEVYVLEANQGSQIVTGHHTEHKMAAFVEFINEHVQGRYITGKPKKLAVIGRHVRVGLPEFELEGLVAKVDTGAYRSALHATHIREINTDGRTVLSFTVEYKTTDGKVIKKVIISEQYGKAFVRNSSGKSEERYRINVVAVIGGREYDMQVTLTNRGGMKFPLLLGRRLLRSNFIVNPELSRKAYEETQ